MKENFKKLCDLIKAFGIESDCSFNFVIKRNEEPILLYFTYIRNSGITNISAWKLDGTRYYSNEIDFDLTLDEVYEIMKLVFVSKNYEDLEKI